MKRLLFALVLAAATVAPALADPAGDFKNAMINFGKATSYHVSVLDRGHAVEIDVVPPGKMHMVAGGMEMIKLDADMYVKIGDAWRKFAIPGADQMASMYKGAIDSATHPSEDITVVDDGMKTVDGAVLHAYTVTDKTHAKLDNTFYLDGNGMPARIESSQGAVIKFSKINAPLTIVAPI